MCGISGWIGAPDPALAQKIRCEISHRGPDDRGEYFDPTVTLLHERLSIIDVKSGHQPMSNEDGRYQIIFNGEIYNHLALRKELEGKGHRFRTSSDTEVILHLYEDIGERCPEKLFGMFAFAIWDSREKSLFIARDRVGIKPLFYAETKDRFIFASELKAIIASGAAPRDLDPEALEQYLTFMYVPAPRTILRGVRKLPPGCSLFRRENHTTVRRYWQLPSGDEQYSASRADAVEELRSLLQEAVRCRLMSEVPLGAYLSGGLDSSLVVALMSLASKEPVNTFSVGFEERGFDERQWARMVAERFRANYRELVVRHHSTDVLPRIIRSLDEPVADSAAIPTYFMAEATKPHVTVVLTGEGADELFAGYSHYKILLWGDRLSPVSPGIAARAMSGALGSIQASRAAEYVGSLRNRPAAWLALKSVFSRAEKAQLLSNPLNSSPSMDAVSEYLGPKKGPFLHQLLRLDLATWLPDDLLVKVDRMTMAHAVEARVPYLDHRVIEAVLRMPAGWKLGALAGKRILRDVARPILPEQIVNRKKTGFAVPVGEWAATEMRDLVNDMLGKKSVSNRGLFRPEAVSPLLGRDSYNMFQRRQLWTLLCLEIWCRQFID